MSTEPLPAGLPPAKPQHEQQINMYANLAQLKCKLREEILLEMHGVEAISTEPACHKSVFSKAVMAAPFLDNFKMPNIIRYNGKEDPAAHVEVFLSWMDFEKVSKQARCQTFPLTLSGLAQSWHNKLPSKSIISFE